MILGIAAQRKPGAGDAFRDLRRCITHSPHAREMATKAHNSGHEVLFIYRWRH